MRNFQTLIFKDWIKTTEEYIPAGPTDRQRLFNYYNPVGDTMSRRPPVVWMHGGGGTIDDGKQWADLCYRGFPVFSFDFGDSGGGFDPANIRQGILHCGAFVRFLHANHKKYWVNANKVILTGTSFGGMIALSYGPAHAKFRDPKYPQFESPVNDLYKKAKQDVVAIGCFPGSMEDEYVPMIDDTCAPVRAYHGVDDVTLPISKTRKVIKDFQAAGIDAVLTEYPAPAGHKLEGLHDTIVTDFCRQVAGLMGIDPVEPPAET